MSRRSEPDASNSFAVERQNNIMERLRTSGRIEASALASEFGLSTETIRRDLIALEQAGSLQRVHGGAVLEQRRGAVPDVRQREFLMTKEKQAIGKLAAALVPAGALVLIDGGTTTRALVDANPFDRALTVVTPSLAVAVALLEQSTASVHTLGGFVSQRTWSESGSWALRALESIRAEVAFLGCSGLSAAQGATTSDHSDGDVKRAMIGAARQVVLLADSSKIGAGHLTTFAALNEIDVLITGSGADPQELQVIKAAGVDVRTA